MVWSKPVDGLYITVMGLRFKLLLFHSMLAYMCTKMNEFTAGETFKVHRPCSPLGTLLYNTHTHDKLRLLSLKNHMHVHMYIPTQILGQPRYLSWWGTLFRNQWSPAYLHHTVIPSAYGGSISPYLKILGYSSRGTPPRRSKLINLKGQNMCSGGVKTGFVMKSWEVKTAF